MTSIAIPRSLHLLHRGLKRLSPDQLLFRKYNKLTRAEKLRMTLRRVLMSLLAIPVASAVYFIFTQLMFPVIYPKGNVRYWDFYLGDLWDRLPNHLHRAASAIGWHFSYGAGSVVPESWFVARHDARYVLIGALAFPMVKSVTAGLGKKDHKPVSRWRILTSPLVVPAAALICAIPGILFFTHAWPGVMKYGLLSNNSYFGTFLGAGKWQLVLIGLSASFLSKRLFNPVAATLQLISIDKKLMEEAAEKRWWKWVYGDAYVNRFRYLHKRYLSEDETERYAPAKHGKALGVFLAFAAFLFVVFLTVGIWVKYFGPAKGA